MGLMMKNFLISTVLIFVLGNLCHFGLPWWGIVPIAAVVAWFFPTSGTLSFLAGLLGGALLWGINAFWLDQANSSMFSAKIGQVFQGLSSANLLYATSFLGGLLGAFGALTGKLARDLQSIPQQRDYYVRRRKSGKYR